MARIAGINIPPHQHAEIGLTAIYGIGRTRARKICDRRGVAFSKKVKDLNDADLEKHPRRRSASSSIEGDLRRETTMNIKRLMDLGCYRGFRHRRACRCAASARAPMPVPARARASAAQSLKK